MAEDFPDDVDAIVGTVLAERGFARDEVDINVDEGGRPGSVVYYRGPDCKIQIYKSSRDGAINSMIAPSNATNQFGPLDRTSQWRFLSEFSPAPDMSIEDLAKSVSYKAKSEVEQLEEVRDLITEYYDDARAGILNEYGHGPATGQ